MSSKYLDKTGLNTLWAKLKSTFQTLGNLVTAWSSTPSDTKYPSEKLVKTALATHTHSILSAEQWENAQLPNNSESEHFKRFYGYVPAYLAAVKLYDVTEFYDGTIVNISSEQSAFVGDVSFIRSGGSPLVSKSKVCMTQGYNSSGVKLYGDSTRCHPIVLKDSRNVLSSWISRSYIPTGNIGSTVNMTPTTNSNMAHCVIDCASYSTLYVNLSSVTGAPAWTFIDSTNKVIAKASSIAANTTLDVPQGAAKIICAIKNTGDSKKYSYVAAESATPRYYLALQTNISMGCYMVCEGRFLTRTTATSTISARPLITEDFAISNTGAESTALPAGYSVHVDTSYTDVAGTLGTARKLAVSLSNTSTDTTFNGSADVTNIKTTGTLPITNGGTGKTTVTAAEYNLLSKMGTDLSTKAIEENYRFVFATTSPSETNGRLAGYRTATAVWNWVKELLTSVSGVNISGNAATASAAQSGSALETAINAKQDALATQTAYSAKGTATKVPQITTNALGQVTNIEEIDIGYSNSTDLVVSNENNSTPYLLYEISNVGLTQSYTTAVTELMVYLVRSSASTPESDTANHMSFKVSIHWQRNLVRTNVEGSLPFGTVTAVLVNSATPAAGSDVSTLKIYLTPGNYVSYRVVVTDNRIRGNGNLVRGTITKRGVREAIPTASSLIIVGTTNVMTMQTKENLITSWKSTPSDTVYPSEKLVKTALDGKSSTTHTHSVSINGNTKTIAASGGTAVDLGTYKVFKYAKVYATQTYDENTNRYILLAFKAVTYTNNWEESSTFKLVVHDGQLPKELVFRLWLNGTMSTGVVPADPSDPKLYRLYSENFSTSALDILDVRIFVVEKSASSITFTIGIFIDRYFLQARWVSYQLYPLSYGTRDRGNTIDNGLSSWTYTVGQDVYNDLHNIFTIMFEVSELPIKMNVVDAYELEYLTGPITSLNKLKLPSNIICPQGYAPQPGGSYIALSQFVKNKTHRFELWQPMSATVLVYNDLGVTIVYRTVTSSGYVEYDVLAQEVIRLNGGGSREKPTSAWATLIGTNLYVTFGY